jgi:hypothetical protein
MEKHIETTISWKSPIVNSKNRVDFCHVIYPAGKPENFRSCVVKGSR